MDEQNPEVFIGLGSNLGRAKENLLAGLEGMKKIPGYRHLALSGCYLTAPVGPQDQPAFFNAVARGIYEGNAPDLLAALLAIEANLGRQRNQRWGPRTLDLDILIFGKAVMDQANLTVPHPEMHRRVFVLTPLAELAPDLVLPRWNMTAGQLLELLSPRELEAQKIEKAAWAS